MALGSSITERLAENGRRVEFTWNSTGGRGDERGGRTEEGVEGAGAPRGKDSTVGDLGARRAAVDFGR